MLQTSFDHRHHKVRRWGPLPSGMRRKRRPKLIDVPIVLMQTLTIACRNIFDSSMPGLYVKSAARAHQDSPTMRAFRLQMRRDHSFDQIPCAKSSYPAWPFGFTNREPMLVNIAHLALLPA